MTLQVLQRRTADFSPILWGFPIGCLLKAHYKHISQIFQSLSNFEKNTSTCNCKKYHFLILTRQQIVPQLNSWQYHLINYLEPYLDLWTKPKKKTAKWVAKTIRATANCQSLSAVTQNTAKISTHCKLSENFFIKVPQGSKKMSIICNNALILPNLFLNLGPIEIT